MIFKLILVTDGCDISSEIALRWTSLDLSDDKSIWVQVMAWCRQAPSHYLNQCWPRSLPPYGVTRPRWETGIEYIFICKRCIWICRLQNFIHFVQMPVFYREKLPSEHVVMITPLLRQNDVATSFWVMMTLSFRHMFAGFCSPPQLTHMQQKLCYYYVMC